MKQLVSTEIHKDSQRSKKESHRVLFFGLSHFGGKSAGTVHCSTVCRKGFKASTSDVLAV